MPLLRRFKLFFIGVSLGLVLIFTLFRNRYPTWLPQSVIIEKLQRNPLFYTNHAKCRMKCRNIDNSEVEYILKTGKVNFKKSKVRNKPCKTYALEGTTSDGQNVRIVFASCDSITKVVTAIDLGNKYDCDCK